MDTNEIQKSLQTEAKKISEKNNKQKLKIKTLKEFENFNKKLKLELENFSQKLEENKSFIEKLEETIENKNEELFALQKELESLG